MYLDDYKQDATVYFKFNTSGALAGSPTLAVYKNNSTTEITAGITLTVDFDSRTNMHHVTIDLSASADYTPESDYDVVFTAGTVGGESVVGRVIRSFSIEHRTQSDAAAYSAVASQNGQV